VSDAAPRVLIVDDDLSFGRFVARVAARCGLRPRVVGGIEAAWEPAEPDPALVLLDLNMPGADGLEALRQLAARHCRARVHVLSGTDARLLRSAAHLGRELGLSMGEPLAKPVTVESLRALFAGAALAESHTPPHPVLEPPTADELRRALARDEIFLVFQPILDLATLEPRGAEALVRWRHPERGVVPPNLFVPLAEHSGLIGELTGTILERALATASRADFAWRGRPLTISVNVATGALAGGDLPGAVAALLAVHALAPARLVLEITESAMLADRARVLEVLSRLRLRGIELSIDDFGTGTSSLERIDQLPCTELKVERAFVADVLRRAQAETIVRSTLELGRRLGLRTVAEGIEDVATLRWLREVGCDMGQGFLFTRGLEPPELLAWLAGWEVRRSELLADEPR
jgi:EAL domain-containing protein (putative c-di-GMP-specific phosphodiesterase class I)